MFLNITCLITVLLKTAHNALVFFFFFFIKHYRTFFFNIAFYNLVLANLQCTVFILKPWIKEWLNANSATCLQANYSLYLYFWPVKSYFSSNIFFVSADLLVFPFSLTLSISHSFPLSLTLLLSMYLALPFLAHYFSLSLSLFLFPKWGFTEQA